MAGFSHSCLVRLIDYPEMPLRMNAREVIKVGRSALLVRVELPIGGRMTPVAYKRIRRLTWIKRLSALPRTNRTLRAWRLGHELLRRGIATARPLAVIIPHRFDVNRASYVVFDWIEGAKNLREWCHSLELDSSARRQKLSAAAVSMGRLLGHMHAQRVSHRDLKPGNVLLVDDGRVVRSHVIDLDGAELCGRLSSRRRLRNLSRLVVGLAELPPIPRTVCLRFLRAYLEVAGDQVSSWKNAWKSLEKTGRARTAQKSRRAA